MNSSVIDNRNVIQPLVPVVDVFFSVFAEKEKNFFDNEKNLPIDSLLTTINKIHRSLTLEL
ncbi:hypothetical protein BpHYR1_042570 [Brachionus plicatilis]|uniref:Uncharacterized protein n=1 Tax=Brachionus plicatilis TaxID=10195 RepID=A0A3M7SBR3_BRAPC|nr:hypothetical protein BpHYR1_042570 [Brachionus plicatilis]